MINTIPNTYIPQLGQIPIEEEIRIHEFCEVRIHEDNDGGKKLDVKLITSGLSKNRNYYSKKVAESVAGLILERPQMYLNHGGWFFSARGLEEIVAIATKSYKKDGKAFAIAEMANNPNTMWLYEFAEKFPEQVGASIDAYVKGREATAADGKLWGQNDYDPEIHPRVQIVEEIKFLNSVDFVTYAAAGGGIEKVLASFIPNVEAMKRITLLAENFDKQVVHIINTQENKGAPMSDTKLTKEDLLKDYSDLVTSLKKDWKAQSQEQSKVGELENEVSTGKIKVTELEGELQVAKDATDELQVKIDEFELKEKVATRKQKIQDMISESELEKEHVSDIFVKDLLKLDGDDAAIKQRIKDRLALVNSSNGEPTDHGTRHREDGNDGESKKFDSAKDETALINEIKGD